MVYIKKETNQIFTMNIFLIWLEYDYAENFIPVVWTALQKANIITNVGNIKSSIIFSFIIERSLNGLEML